ncbi:PREDICTED: U2 small nuclear ribonucleoprotein auxiliary factor 35 kDa subunit-related protein 2-like [Branchiostoma belcheri]|uniref:U2 small nuclear ribonucleoprotein auxiliary factor 35 kDa subunit-related protein 2-like n=1 Tax=Branchiostoma belcheri TaxID=7741 RepID=A0A6P4YBA3_BRABE|nr:PREDICTED: U2 small nuclear ribonucleoprotein auxiliary factor 35 kDa subunit-related protein 2-like [Branchiostoma belcheri]
MAQDSPGGENGQKQQKLSHKQRKALWRKEKRRKKRQEEARAREEELQEQGTSEAPEKGEESEEEKNRQEEAAERYIIMTVVAQKLIQERQHQLWLEREARAQHEFRVRREREETRRREQEEQERLIREEWEEQQRKEKEAKERKEREKKEQEVTALCSRLIIFGRFWRATSTLSVKLGLDAGFNQQLCIQNLGNPCSGLVLTHDASVSYQDKLNRMLASTGTSGNKKKDEWHNPIAPADYSAGGEVPAPTGRAAEDCPFFKKTGACRFGDRCSRKHTRPDTSTTLLIPGMFGTFALDQTQRDDFDETMYLEYGEDELYKDFIEFYNDALPEFRTLGRVIQFKVCCNHEPHLRGNVYVQYDREEDCLEAIKKFHGRFYAGRQLTCEMTPVTSWKSAICGLFSRKKCPKGKNCNFLHVFPNPGREFRDADEDLHLEGLRRDQHDSRRSWREFSERRGSVSSRSVQYLLTFSPVGKAYIFRVFVSVLAFWFLGVMRWRPFLVPSADIHRFFISVNIFRFSVVM